MCGIWPGRNIRPSEPINKVFDDPLAVRALVERHGPYRAIASYLPVSATLGEHAIAAGGGTHRGFGAHGPQMVSRWWTAPGSSWRTRVSGRQHRVCSIQPRWRQILSS